MNQMPIKVKCQVCGKTFPAKRYLVEKGYGKYCGKKCADLGLSKKIEVICETCGRQFPSVPSRNAKYCSRECFHKKAGQNRRNKVEVECPVCGKTFLTVPSRISDGFGKYCSRECSSQANRGRWTGERNPNWGGGLVEHVCLRCGKTYTARRVLVDSKYCGYPCYWAYMKEDTGVRETMLEVAAEGMKVSPSKLEIAGYQILDSIGVEYLTQEKVADKFIVDAFIPACDIVIQFDGDYWHGNPSKYRRAEDLDSDSDRRRPLNKIQKGNMKKDKGQSAYLRKCGYAVLRFWESDVKKNPEDVRLRILDAIDGHLHENV